MMYVTMNQYVVCNQSDILDCQIRKKHFIHGENKWIKYLVEFVNDFLCELNTESKIKPKKITWFTDYWLITWFIKLIFPFMSCMSQFWHVSLCIHVTVLVCVCEREKECMSVFVWKTVFCVSLYERHKECACDYVRDRKNVCAGVCVRWEKDKTDHTAEDKR